MGTWHNSDGLFIKFGVDEADVRTGGEMQGYGPHVVVELEIPAMSVLTTTAAILEGWDDIFFPDNARIEEVQVVVKTACVGATATLDIGLVDEDRSTAVDDDGFVAALAVASLDAAGETTILRVGSTSAGALIGTTTTAKTRPVASYNTAAFTAGAIWVRVLYRTLAP